MQYFSESVFKYKEFFIIPEYLEDKKLAGILLRKSEFLKKEPYLFNNVEKYIQFAKENKLGNPFGRYVLYKGEYYYPTSIVIVDTKGLEFVNYKTDLDFDINILIVE